MDCGCSIAETLRIFSCMYVCMQSEQWGIVGLGKNSSLRCEESFCEKEFNIHVLLVVVFSFFPTVSFHTDSIVLLYCC